VLHGYCVRSVGDPAPDAELRGVARAAVLLVEEGELALWCSELERRPEVTVERLREHDAVVRAALRSATPLPLRYGASFADEEKARAALREKQEEFRASLTELDNRVEMGIRVAYAAGATPPREENGGGPAPPVTTGREYLEARRRALEVAAATRADAEEMVGRVEAGLADMALPGHRQILPQEGVLGLVAHLVHRGEVGLYRQRVQRLREELPELDLLLSGPWAPYSFV
jgi:hypothetical protein